MSPLPTVPHKNLPKRPYDCTPEETEQIANAEYQEWWTNRGKKPQEPKFPNTPEEKAAAFKMLKNLENPPPRLSGDYDRSILKAVRRKKLKSTATSGRSVPQLGEQKKQSIPPLIVQGSNTQVAGSSRGAHDDVDPEFVVMYGEAAAARGMTIAQYLDQLEVQELAYKYQYGRPLVKPELVKELPTKMQRVHKWYMEATKKSANWINIGIKNEYFGNGDGMLMIEFVELFQLFNQDAIDKAILSVYCL